MNWSGIDGTWQRFKGKVKEQWALADEEQLDGEHHGNLTDMIHGTEPSAWDSDSDDIPKRGVVLQTALGLGCALYPRRPSAPRMQPLPRGSGRAEGQRSTGLLCPGVQTGAAPERNLALTSDA
jgi:hypothetical protein